MMRVRLLGLAIAFACLSSQVQSKTVFRRTDKISENFKQLNLAPEEVDPNVAPPVKQELVQTIDPETAAASTGSVDISVNDGVDVIVEPVTAPDEVVDEAANEVEDVVDDVVENVVEAVTEVPAVAAVAAVATTTPKPVKTKPTQAIASAVNATNGPQGLSKYCKCTESSCDCCRNIGLPILPVRSKGCAKLTYLGNEKMSVSLKYGDLTLATRTISGKKARPICVGLPGGYNKFCGRMYGLAKGKDDFKACLGFELRADDEVEAALRVSCFRFGPGGLRVAEAEPLPSELNKDEDDDDDDIFGFGGGGDDDDDDDYDADDNDEDEEDDEEYADGEETEAPEDADYGGFSLGGLLAELADEDEETTVSNKPNKNKPSAVTVATDSTRTATTDQKGVMQSKNVKGKADGTADAAASIISDADAIVSAEEAAVPPVPVTPAPAVADVAATTTKAKKAKKNKKKKENSEPDFAFEILNGILDFFN